MRALNSYTLISNQLERKLGKTAHIFSQQAHFYDEELARYDVKVMRESNT